MHSMGNLNCEKPFLTLVASLGGQSETFFCTSLVVSHQPEILRLLWIVKFICSIYPMEYNSNNGETFFYVSS